MALLPELSPGQLRRTFDPAALSFETTADLQPLSSVIGQDRAVSALRFGLGIQDHGFNIYVAGPSGIGKMSAVRAFLEALSGQQPTPADWCYVNNFDDAYQPAAIKLPPGRGRKLQGDTKALIERARRDLPRAFEAEEYGAKRDELMRAMEHQRTEVLTRLADHALSQGFGMQVTPHGIASIPLRNGEPMSDADFAALPQEEKDAIRAKHEALQQGVRATMKEVRDLERAAQDRLQALNQQIALYVVGGLIEDLSEAYADQPAVLAHLQAVQRDILDNIELFRLGRAPSTTEAGVPEAMLAPWLLELPFRRYAVNVIVDNGGQTGAPVVVEANPAYNNLFGRIEKESQFGALFTDFTMIKPGSLFRANGGYLVLEIDALLREPFSWDGLKRALRAGQAQIEEPIERLGVLAAKSLRPQPIPLDFKVILVGRGLYFQLLQAYDPDFVELFKVRADFDTCMPLTDENVAGYLSFLSMACRKSGYRHLDRGAAARMLEHACRMAADQTKLTTEFGVVADIVREANYWAGQAAAPHIAAEHVQAALDQRVYRSNLTQERLREMITRDMLLIDVDGAKVGQINALSVLSLGDYDFGQPTRITASIEPGRAGVINIEREVELSGPIHSKGVLILSGYLAGQYGRDMPVALSARLAFEQSYAAVEGDSASSAELYALLSALADLPIAQSIAVTGSVNQRGEVQVIGGVNEKIEGFYDVCRAKGLNGHQGVIVPAGNAPHLMLRQDVIDAVDRGDFHLWPVRTIDEGIQLLTGVAAGERDGEGEYPPESVHGRAAARLREIGRLLRDLGRSLVRELGQDTQE